MEVWFDHSGGPERREVPDAEGGVGRDHKPLWCNGSTAAKRAESVCSTQTGGTGVSFHAAHGNVMQTGGCTVCTADKDNRLAGF